MRKGLSLALAAILLSFVVASGCVKQYVLPSVDEPHVVVKIRRVFHTSPGELRATSILLNKEQVLSRDEAASFDAPQTDAIRVHPGPGWWEISAIFHHQEIHQVHEHYYEQVPYMASETYSESQPYSCGTSTCYRSVPCTRMVTKYRQELKTRWVTKITDHVDDRCDQSFRRTMVAGDIYVLQFTYTGTGICNVVCLQQSANAASAELRPCAAN